MALDTTTPHVTPFALIDHGVSGSSNYTTGGTNLGLVLSHAIVGYEREGEVVTRPGISGIVPWDYRWLGDIVTLQVVLGLRTSDVLKLAHRPKWASTNSGLLLGVDQLKKGQRVRSAGKTTRLQIRAMNDDGSAAITTRPHLYLPKAFCIGVEARQWSRQGSLLEASVLTILGLTDDDDSPPFYEGDAGTFPSLT